MSQTEPSKITPYTMIDGTTGRRFTPYTMKDPATGEDIILREENPFLSSKLRDEAAERKVIVIGDADRAEVAKTSYLTHVGGEASVAIGKLTGEGLGENDSEKKNKTTLLQSGSSSVYIADIPRTPDNKVALGFTEKLGVEGYVDQIIVTEQRNRAQLEDTISEFYLPNEAFKRKSREELEKRGMDEDLDFEQVLEKQLTPRLFDLDRSSKITVTVPGADGRQFRVMQARRFAEKLPNEENLSFEDKLRESRRHGIALCVYEVITDAEGNQQEVFVDALHVGTRITPKLEKLDQTKVFENDEVVEPDTIVLDAERMKMLNERLMQKIGIAEVDLTETANYLLKPKGEKDYIREAEKAIAIQNVSMLEKSQGVFEAKMADSLAQQKEVDGISKPEVVETGILEQLNKESSAEQQLKEQQLEVIAQINQLSTALDRLSNSVAKELVRDVIEGLDLSRVTVEAIEALQVRLELLGNATDQITTMFTSLIPGSNFSQIAFNEKLVRAFDQDGLKEALESGKVTKVGEYIAEIVTQTAVEVLEFSLRTSHIDVGVNIREIIEQANIRESIEQGREVKIDIESIEAIQDLENASISV